MKKAHKKVLKLLDLSVQSYGAHFDAKALSYSVIDASDELSLTDVLALFHKAGFLAYATPLGKRSNYPMLYIKEGEIVGLSLPHELGIVTTLDLEKVEEKKFFGETEVEGCIVIPPQDRLEKENLNWFWGSIRKMKGLHVELLVVGFFVNMFALALPLYTLSIYDRVLPTFATPTLWALTIGIALIIGLDFMFKMHKAKLLSKVQTQLAMEQDELLLDDFLRQKHHTISSGSQLEFFKLLKAARENVLFSIFPAMVDAPFVLFFLFVIYYLSASLVFVPIALIVVVFLVQAVMIPRLNALTHKSLEADNKRESLLYEILFSNISVRLMNATGRVLSLWRSHSHNLQHISEKNYVWQQLGKTLIGSLTQVSAVLILVVGVFEVNNGVLTAGGLIASSILSARAISPALNLVDALVKLQKVKAVLADLNKIQSSPKEIANHCDEAPEKLISPEGRLECRDVVVVYPKMPKAALDGISLKIEKGERVAILGRNGAGKSTLAKTFASLITPQSGQVLCDGVDLKRLPVTELRQHLLLIAQEHHFMSGTLRQAIAGEVSVDEERLKSAVEMSGLSQMLSSSGIGLDADIGEDGSHLSGGQRQMLTLASALYRQPKILIMDEPTSHFDHELELKVRENLKIWLHEKNPTFVLITHRLTLLDLVERLIVVDNGRIILDGSKAEVLQKLGGNV